MVTECLPNDSLWIKSPGRIYVSLIISRVFNVSIVIDVFSFRLLQETPGSVSAKAGPSEAGPPKAASSPKDSLSPKTEADGGETSCSSWVVDSAGFLSPTGPALKEVLDMVDGVIIPDTTNKQPVI